VIPAQPAGQFVVGEAAGRRFAEHTQGCQQPQQAGDGVPIGSDARGDLLRRQGFLPESGGNIQAGGGVEGAGLPEGRADLQQAERGRGEACRPLLHPAGEAHEAAETAYGSGVALVGHGGLLSRRRA